MMLKPGITFFIVAVLISMVLIHRAGTPPAEISSPADTAFSVPVANQYLKQIARAPHSTGTPENARVRAYIAATCAGLGLDTSIQHASAVTSWGSGIMVGNVYNVIARLKGAHTGKTVIVAAHYDSQPNALGAADDGASCAAMLETARILKAAPPLQNDVIFLFTDGEEDGLLGANAFVRESPLFKETGIVLNFEARGSSGVSSMFETNAENGWVMREYMRSGAHKDANSLSYEIYKHLPNGTDYTLFKGAGIAGLNHAFIDGFVDYHSMTDRPDRLDRNTFQEQGDNMLSLVRHFGNIDLRQTKAPDITFFNVVGSWMIHYPAPLNALFIILTNVLLLAGLVVGLARKQIRGWGLVAGIVAFPVVLIILFFISSGILQAIRSASPLYDGYYDNAYNTGYYFFALAVLGIAIFALLYQWLLRRFTMSSLWIGALLCQVIAMDLLYSAIPSAIYFLCFPLLFAEAAALLYFYDEAAANNRPWRSGIITLVLLLPAIVLLTPMVASLFIAFGVSNQTPAVIVLLGFLLGLTLPLLAGVRREARWLIPGGAFGLFGLGILTAFLHRGYTPQEPYKTSLRYLLDADSGAANWVTDAEPPDAWTRQFFPHPHTGHTIGGSGKDLIDTASVLPLQAPSLTVKKDTLENGVRLLTLHCQPSPGAVSVRLNFDKNDTAYNMWVDGKQAGQVSANRHAYRWLDYRGVTSAGFDIMFQLDPAKPFGTDLISRSMGLPALQGFHGYPPGIIPGPGDFSNTTIVVRHNFFRATSVY
jgi:Peptidase family M28